MAIDARFYDIMNIGKDYSTCPIAINDNLIDIMINQTSDGQLANVDWRPKSSVFSVNSSVVGKVGGQTSISITAGGIGVINVSGTITKGAGQIDQTYTVPDPVGFARTLFVESLERNGVAVGAAAVAPQSVRQTAFQRRLRQRKQGGGAGLPAALRGREAHPEGLTEHACRQLPVADRRPRREQGLV